MLSNFKNHARLLFVLLLLFGKFTSAQQNLNRYEKRWALFHPFASLQIKKIHRNAKPVYDSLAVLKIPDAYPNDGQTDAFRHAYFMALFAQKIKNSKVQRLGELHEKENKKNFVIGKEEYKEISDSISTRMDLLNNEVGIMLGKQNRNLSKYAMRDLILKAITQQKLYFVLRNNLGEFVNCKGEKISPEELRKWNNNRCLVN